MKKKLFLSAAVFVFSATTLSFAATESKTIDVKVTYKGFEPSKIEVAAGSNVTLKITRTTDSTCATQIKVPNKKITADLPMNKAVELKLGKLDKGEVRFACGMNMVSGVIVAK